MDFKSFSDNVHLGLHDMLAKPNEVFITSTSADGSNEADDLFALYLASFPEGTNPVYKTRTEYDCNCCKQFIRNIGSLIRIKPDGSVQTVWDELVDSHKYPYSVVASALRERVLASPITDRFFLAENNDQFGKAVTRVLFEGDSDVTEFHHFYSGKIPKAYVSRSPGTELNRYRTAVQVMERGLKELRIEDVDTMLSLIETNALYRGEEHKNAVLGFRSLKASYAMLTSDLERNRFLWSNSHKPAAMFRNTVIGTLVQDLSDGKELEQAVRAFEHKVAPTNYKRTTALVTPGMINKAMETIQSLDLEPALERRFARIEDVSVNDVIWVDSTVKPLMKGGLADTLMAHVLSTRTETADPTKNDSAESIPLDEFVHRILPETQGLEIWFTHEHVGNMMSLTAPVHPEPKKLFKWDNDFAWSYGGNVTDSIKERVKRAGGQVENTLLRVSLSWFNYDDLDLHIHQPVQKGYARNAARHTDIIYYGNKRGWTGGYLDVDMNVNPTTREAVENVVWNTHMPDGEYTVAVNNFNQRETNDVGFVLEVEHDGKITQYSYNRELKRNQKLLALNLTIRDNKVVKCDITDNNIVSSSMNVEKWGLTTNQWVKVNTVTLSPNYWGNNKVGNKHTFFVLDGALNNEPCRGIYNEFLDSRLETHRKVFELIGNKTMCQPTENQLSGLGFSSTRQTTFLARVKQGRRQRTFKVVVGAAS